VRSIRFYKAGTATANWSDNAFLFIDGLAANPFLPTPVVPYGSSGPGVSAAVGNQSIPGSPMGAGTALVPPGEGPGTKPLIWANTLHIYNDGSNDLEFTFSAIDDAGSTNTQVHGVVKAGKDSIYRQRYEAGIAVRSVGGTTFRIEAW
jgi:hypothetical protein